MTVRTLAAATAVALCLGHTATAQEYNLSLAHWVPATHPLQVLGMEPWMQSITEESGGRITFTVYPAQQLGAAADHYDMARDGIADIAFINPGYQPGRFPILAAAELPFLFANATGAVRGLTEWYQQGGYDDMEMGDVYFCMALTHDPGTMHGKEPILVPEDVRGRTVRPANATEARFVNLLGGASVQVPAPAMREVLSNGTADITQSPWQSLYIFGADTLVTHHLDMPFYASINGFVMNRGMIDGMPEDLRTIMTNHCSPEAAETMSTGWAGAEAAGRASIAADPAHTMHTPNAEQVALWQAAAEPLTAEWLALMASQGRDGEAMLQGLRDALARYDGLYGQ
ncbi:TRAP transporter substrate-binding protein [Pararhodobacter aggregans]|uniref:C4-dicarboxylate ABC transporter n=1 Tax=Pararhodobacter aggregans TaxID=404875 RepID=A0A2T7UUH1_9RHOB|nr:TRAP transporter substrate-binding protein [Pararhodobacter aggregans]PTX04240.1 TRAP-type C4-dicarboxylate transport system substrate-binding protein [Pararhodobacter aggregans]PVE48314.1 C4-dicarboxylate ABC transporter [Pararhodobacter aggregans]